MTEINLVTDVTIGSWVAVVGPRAWLIADVDATSDMVRVTCLDLVRAGTSPERIAEALGATRSFAVARIAGGELNVLVAGDATVTVTTARDGDRHVDGRSGTAPASFGEFQAIILGGANVPADGPAFPLETGVMPASRIAVTVSPATPSTPEPSPESPAWLASIAPPPAPRPAEPPRSPAEPQGSPGWPDAVVSEPAAPPAVRVPSVPSVDRLSQTLMPPNDDDRDVELPPWLPQSPSSAAPSSPSASVASRPASGVAEPAAPWIPASSDSLSDLSWAFGGATVPPVPAPPPPSTLPPWPPTVGAPVASGAEPLQSTVSRDQAGRPSGLRPPGRIRLSNGKVITLDGGVVLGRMPGDGRSPGDKEPGARYRIRLDNSDQTLSRQHVAVRVEGDRIVVADLESANGTWVTPPGGQRRLLGKGESCPVAAGTVIHLDEKTWFEVLS